MAQLIMLEGGPLPARLQVGTMIIRKLALTGTGKDHMNVVT